MTHHLETQPLLRVEFNPLSSLCTWLKPESRVNTLDAEFTWTAVSLALAYQRAQGFDK